MAGDRLRSFSGVLPSGGVLQSFLAHARGERAFVGWHLLAPLGWVVGAWTRWRNRSFDHGVLLSEEPPLPVVSVGNLTLGGTNKTPFVAMLVETLVQAGLSPGVVSRGYGGRARTPLLVEAGRGDRTLSGDEPLLLSAQLRPCPVCVAADRRQGVALLAQRGCQVVVADDAFQHRRMGRDVDVVLVDATCPLGNGRYFPAGLLREGVEGLGRAHAVVLTKVDQVTPEVLKRLERCLEKIVPPERIFRSRLAFGGWFRTEGDSWIPDVPDFSEGVWAFSAIGSPESFRCLLERQGVPLRGERLFRDHHHYTMDDVMSLERMAREAGARALVCTEKDVYNLPCASSGPGTGDVVDRGRPKGMPLWFPRVRTVLDDPGRFWETLGRGLVPRLVVASNGFGEDAMGSLLADKLRRRFPGGKVEAFPLVGRGQAYVERHIPVLSPPAETPSGGVVKYSWGDLWRDLRSGLLGQVRGQFRAWEGHRGRVRTVLCVGDVYLLLHTLWGQGQAPLLVATAKSELLGGHWHLERLVLRHRCRMVWTRDGATAEELRRHGVPADFRGNPIMDLAEEDIQKTRFAGDNICGQSEVSEEPMVLLLPGSRGRAYDDLALLLDAAARIAARQKVSFLLVLAPTLERLRFEEAVLRTGWRWEGNFLQGPGTSRVRVTSVSVARAAEGARVVLGLGGTANQVCAGLGIPVVSVLEKGKLVQKKLLGEAEVLVPPEAEALAQEVDALLQDEIRRRTMGQAGYRALGGGGALSAVEAHVASVLGWEVRCAVAQRLNAFREASVPPSFSADAVSRGNVSASGEHMRHA